MGDWTVDLPIEFIQGRIVDATYQPGPRIKHPSAAVVMGWRISQEPQCEVERVRASNACGLVLGVDVAERLEYSTVVASSFKLMTPCPSRPVVYLWTLSFVIVW
jgi:hypothetical protein